MEQRSQELQLGGVQDDAPRGRAGAERPHELPRQLGPEHDVEALAGRQLFRPEARAVGEQERKASEAHAFP